MSTILLIDDDVELAELLKEFFQLEHLVLQHAANGELGLAYLQGHQVDLVLLDVMMPGLNGFEVLKNIRQSSVVPVLMLTARGDESDKILGLELGADDYLAKPYSPRELLARVQAILRRIQFEQQKSHSQSIVYGNLQLNLATFQALVAGQALVLTATEFRVLSELFAQLDIVHSKESLYLRVLGREMEPFDRSIDMHVSNLRKKLAALNGPADKIITVRGVGYRVEVA